MLKSIRVSEYSVHQRRKIRMAITSRTHGRAKQENDGHDLPTSDIACYSFHQLLLTSADLHSFHSSTPKRTQQQNQKEVSQ